MSVPPWNVIASVFTEAVEVSPEERNGVLDRRCGHDRELRREVEELLRAHESASLLDRSAADLLLAGAIDVEVPLTGTLLGPYRIIAPVGQGGMGAVYRAVRDDEQYRKEVALKVVRGGMDDPAVVRRFMEERQILASLEHPNIVRLLDGGMTEDGRPWVAMEFVADGLPLDHYADRFLLDIPARLRLFNAAASAVHYAHQNLVVHRDLKMGNILVTPSGEVKLLDFGIARFLRDDAAVEPGELTRIGLRMMTPEYASPEQITGGAVTTTSDVYALGVILYILLSGHRPYALWNHGPTHELERAICQEDPPPPGMALRRIDNDVPAIDQIAKCRSTTPDRLRRELSGDLDTIVMRAMDKSPSRRYASVQGLEEDIDRYLNGLPVLARRNTPGYRAGKFIRRHRVGVASASGLAFSIVGFGISMARQRSRIARQAGQIRHERDRAERVVAFLKDLFFVSEPGRIDGGGDVTARELLERGRHRIETELAADPAAQSELMGVIGQVQLSLGLVDEAVSILRHGVDRRSEAFGADSIEYASMVGGLAGALRIKGELSEAEPLFRTALDIACRQGGERTELVADILNELGILMNTMQRYDEGERALRHALEIRRQVLPRNHTDLPRSLNNIGLLLVDLRRFDEAEGLFREALAMLRRIRPDGSLDAASTLNNLGFLMRSRNRLDEAEAFDREALSIRRRFHGRDHPDLAQSLNNLGNLLYRRDRPSEAAELFNEAIDLWRRLLGPDHPDVIVGMTNLAQVERRRGDLAAAQTIIEKALALQRRRLNDNDPAVTRSMHLLGELQIERGNVEEGVKTLRKVLAARATQPGEGNWREAMTACALAEGLERLGQYDEAGQLYAMSADVLKQQNHVDAKRPVSGLERMRTIRTAR